MTSFAITCTRALILCTCSTIGLTPWSSSAVLKIKMEKTRSVTMRTLAKNSTVSLAMKTNAHIVEDFDKCIFTNIISAGMDHEDFAKASRQTKHASP